MAILLTTADGLNCLAVARALSSRGLPVLAVGPPRSVTFYSRAITRALVFPGEPSAFARFVLDAVRAHDVELVIPLDDTSLLALAAARLELEGRARLAAPALSCLRLTLDKEALARYANSVDVPTPRTFDVRSPEDARAAADVVGYPLVLKPVGSGGIGDLPPGLAFKVHYATRREELEEFVRSYGAGGRRLLIQEYCPGFALNLEGMYADGELLGIVAYLSLKTHPLIGLVGVVRETVSLPAPVRDQVSRLLRGLEYQGLFNIQFRQHPRDGVWRLTDFNPRGGVFHETAIRAGVDLPYLAYEWFVQGRKRYAHGYRVGVRGRWLAGDVLHTALVLRGKEKGIDPHYPSRLQAVRDFLLEFLRTDHCDEFTIRDPLPALMAPLNYGYERLVQAARSMMARGFG